MTHTDHPLQSTTTGGITVVVPVLSDLYFQILLCEFDIAGKLYANFSGVRGGVEGLNRKIEVGFLNETAVAREGNSTARKRVIYGGF